MLTGDNRLSASLSPLSNSVILFYPQMPGPFKALKNGRQRARPRAITPICHPLGSFEGGFPWKEGG